MNQMKEIIHELDSSQVENAKKGVCVCVCVCVCKTERERQKEREGERERERGRQREIHEPLWVVSSHTDGHS